MPSFCDLPLEIALEIIKSLCPHCTNETQGPCMDENCTFNSSCGCAHHWNPSYGPFDVATLAALCRVSKHVNSMATAHLYHRPTCANWWLLARPDLGRHVRDLHGHSWKLSSDTACPQEVLDHYSPQDSVTPMIFASLWRMKNAGPRLLLSTF